MPELSTHNKGFWTWRQAAGVCDGVCVCGEEEEGEGSSEIMMSKNYWGRKRRYAALQPDTKLILRQGGFYLFLFTVNLWWNKKLCGREVGELSLLGLIYEKKEKKPEGRQSSVA